MTSPDSAAPSRFRHELHGLRGVAIGLVVLYHVWFDRVSGGVDIFLFLSAFLLTGTFVRRAEQGAPLRPLAYWARTFKRLLPPTAVVSLATLAATWLWLPESRWMQALNDALGSMLQVENWVLIRRGVNYYAADAGGPSLFQHFWSLSIQGQIFLAWPILITLAVVAARRLKVRVVPMLLGVFAIVLLTSFVWSVYSTSVQQTVAYFDTRTRAWEFAAGSVLALLLPKLEKRWRKDGAGGRFTFTRILLGWVGLIGVISCGLVIDVEGAFPGWIAAWPLISATLVLAAGETKHPLSADRLLTSAPLKFIGDVSYALYLVHWPLLLVYLEVRGQERAGALGGFLLIATSLVLAWLLTRVVDEPIRRSPWLNAEPLRAFGAAALALIIGVAPAFGAREYLKFRADQAAERAAAENPGAAVLDPQAPHFATPWADTPPIPDPATVSTDWVSLPLECTDDGAPKDPLVAERCRTNEAPDGAPILAILGSSRMQQMAPALVEVAEEEGWQVVQLWRRSCNYMPGIEHWEEECTAYNTALKGYLAQLQPDAVALTTTTVPHKGEEVVVKNIEESITDLRAGGANVIAVRDEPRLEFNPNTCVEDNDDDASQCEAPASRNMAEVRPDQGILESVDPTGKSVVPVDLTSVICPDDLCTPIIGNVRVYLDADHITATYAQSMSWAVRAQLDAAGWQWTQDLSAP